MLGRLNGATRVRAAAVLALLYALCAFAPAAAFAFGDGSRAAHCLTDTNHGLQSINVLEHAPSHVDQGDATHAHAQTPGSSDHHGKASADGNCCGLVCLSALPTATVAMDFPVPVYAAAVLVLPESPTGQGPILPYRPPNSSTVALN